MDTNGDGVGDFQGLMRRLDYLQGLGVTAIWLMPFQPSPHRDDGYDIADYYSVDPRYGTLGDFVEFTHGCSSAACASSSTSSSTTPPTSTLVPGGAQRPESPFRDWYVWSKKKPRTPPAAGVPRRTKNHLDVRREGARILLPPLLRISA